MADHRITIHWKRFSARFVLPTAVTFCLFITSFFLIMIPTIERSIMDRKREMIQELTNSAWNILAKLEHDEQAGLLTREEAQAQAIDQIRNLHYGQEMKDYFWINDMHPRMVIHPYRTDLNGQDLTQYTDPEGTRVFVEFVRIVRESGAGFASYKWQWKDDPGRILPKISYVKGFKPWDWIIGTGIYVDDVRVEIRRITHNTIKISLIILIVIAALLAFIIRQSFLTLKNQQLAEQSLRESEEKYRTLVESSGDGILMAIQGRFTYANQTIANLLERTPGEMIGMIVEDLFPVSIRDTHPGLIERLNEASPAIETIEVPLLTRTETIKEVIFSISPIEIGGKDGFIAAATDITLRKRLENEIGKSEAMFRALATNVRVGIFRIAFRGSPHFIEVNPALVELLGYPSREELLATPFETLFVSTDECRAILSARDPALNHERTARLLKKNRDVICAAIHGTIVTDEPGHPQFLDGVMRDITIGQQQERTREQALSELQTTVFFLHSKLMDLPIEKAVIISGTPSLGEIMETMRESGTEFLAIRGDSLSSSRLVTRQDILHLSRLGLNQTEGIPPESIFKPLISIDEHATVFEAWLRLDTIDLPALLVTASDGSFKGFLSCRNLMSLQSYSPVALLKKIQGARSQDEVIQSNAMYPELIVLLIRSGARPEFITHLTTRVIDSILEKFIQCAIEELGPPPVEFAFIVFGSEGRKEQTLRTDQDNAIIFEDTDAADIQTIQSYFLELGQRVCGWLDQAGYTYCAGNNMAQNPKWCRPLSAWKKYFSEWIHQSTAEDLLNLKIFFDFRCAFGKTDIETRLRDYIDQIAPENPRFFQLLVRNVLPMTPPIGMFGQFLVESVSDRGKVLDMKSAMMPIIDFARIYSIRHRIQATNTLDRLHALRDRGILTDKNYEEMAQAYRYLMQIRLRMQAETMASATRQPDNYISPDSLTYIEQRLLKEIFAQTKHFMARMSYDFTGQ